MLLFRQLFHAETCAYSYLIACTETQQAILVDSVLEQHERDQQLIQELGLQLIACIETHIHADHITAAKKLKLATNCDIIMPKTAETTGADREITDNEAIDCGNLSIKAIHTPGHTACHMSYLIDDTHLLSGDALFIRGCGRTDFQAGDAATLYDSVTKRLFSLPPETLVYPGHDYQGFSCSTIGEEMRYNKRFANRNKADFMALMTELQLPMPKHIKQAVPANLQCGTS